MKTKEFITHCILTHPIRARTRNLHAWKTNEPYKFTLKYHSNPIFTTQCPKNSSFILSSCSYETPTTKRYLNTILTTLNIPATIVQSNFKWYLQYQTSEGITRKIPIKDKDDLHFKGYYISMLNLSIWTVDVPTLQKTILLEEKIPTSVPAE